jgi:AraC-like DNA-binding protein
MAAFAPIVGGRERWSAGTRIPRHRHAQAYAAVVLSGGYEECGSQGRFRVRAGDVLLHGAFDAHLDRFDTAAAVLNLPLDGAAFACTAARVRDPDAVARLAERDSAAAAASLLAQLRPAAREPDGWPDRLASDLRDDPGLRLDAWAEEHGLAPATVSRGFARVFGVSPCVFRAEARVRRALAAIGGTALPLAGVAASHGFADQAHMTRAVCALTGLSPRRLRSNGFKTVLH